MNRILSPTLLILLALLCSQQTHGQTYRTTADKLFDEGQFAYEAGRYQEAAELYSKVLTKSPGYKEAYLTRALTREQLRDWQGAITDYSVFLEMTPAHYEALLGRANARFRLGKYEEAKSDYQQLLNIRPGETNMVYFQKAPSTTGTMQITTAQSDQKHLIYNYLGLAELRLSNFNAAIKWLDSAIHLNPRESDYYVNRGMVYENIDKRKAFKDYEAALKINPGHTAALHNLGVLNHKEGKDTDFLEKAIESDSTMLYPYLERGFQRLQAGYYKGAIEDYSQALKLESNDPEIWLNRGLARERSNDLKGAYADYTKAIALDEKFEKAWLNRGNVLNKLGRFEEAIEDYTVALTYNDEYGPAFYNRAIALDKLKRYSEACSDLQKAEKLNTKVDAKLKQKVCEGN